MKKKILFGLLIFLLVAGVAAFVYINKVLLPVKLKEILLTRSQEFLGRKVTFDKIDYHFFQGIVIDNLTVYEREDAASAFVHIAQARLSVLITPILREKKIIVPSLIITQPQIHIVRQDLNLWNFSDLLNKRRPASPKSPFTFFLGGATIEGGQLEFTDKTPEVPTEEKFTNLNLKAHLSVKNGIRFQGGIQGPSGASLAILGSFELLKKTLAAEAKIQKLDPFKYLKMFYANPNFVHRSGTIDTADLRIKFNAPTVELNGNISFADVDVTLPANKAVQGSTMTATDLRLVRKNNTTQLTANLAVKNGILTLDNGKTFAGDLTAEGLELAFNEKGAELKAKIDFQNAQLLLAPDRLIKGHLSAKQLSYKRTDNVIVVHGDLLAQNAELNWNSQSFKGTFSTPRATVRSTDGDIEATGSFEVQGADFIVGETAVKGNIKTGDTALTFSKDKELTVKTAFLLENSQIDLKGDKKVSGTFQADRTVVTFADPKLTAAGRLQVTQGTLSLPPDREFSGDPVIDFKIAHTLNSQTPPLYSGSLTVANGTLKGLPKVGQVEQIKGTVDFANDRIHSDSLQVKTLDTDIWLAGTLQNFTAPDVDVELSTVNINLEKIRPYFAELLEKYQISPDGVADLKLRYKGPLDNAKLAQISFSANLKEASLTGEKLPGPINNISGKVNYSSQGLSWENLTGIFKQKKYTLSGVWRDLTNPLIETTVNGDEFNLAAKIQTSEGVYKILSLKGKYYGSAFDVDGDFKITEKDGPDVSLSGHIDLNLENLSLLWPAFKDKIQSYKPVGILSLDTMLIGKIKDWRHCRLNATGASENLTLNDIRFQDVSLKLEHGKFPTSQVDIAALFYNGRLRITSFLDPQRNDIPMSLAANLDDTDLAQLAQGINDKNKNKSGKKLELAGNLDVDLKLEGPLSKVEKWKGLGSATITDGQIFKFNLLKGLGRALLIPEFEDIVFTHARTTFEIRNKKVITSDLILNSSVVDLSANGWVDFDQNVNLDIVPQFKELTILQSVSGKKGPTVILTEAQKYIINIKISGTLQKPEYNKNLTPIRALEKATGSILEGAQGILDDIINN